MKIFSVIFVILNVSYWKLCDSQREGNLLYFTSWHKRNPERGVASKFTTTTIESIQQIYVENANFGNSNWLAEWPECRNLVTVTNTGSVEKRENLKT